MTVKVLNLENELAVLANCIRLAAQPPEHELLAFCGMFRLKQFSSGQPIFKAGRLINHIYFIVKGCLQLYHEQVSGTIKTIGFYEEQDFVMDMYSFVEQQPTTLNLQAAEDAILLIINRTHWNRACREFSWYKAFHTQYVAQQLDDMYQYLTHLKAFGAGSSYAQLITSRPKLLQRLPAHLLADYLSVTVEELNRLTITGS
ncbi:Crp/Fnr family transcriptional regulator [Mucilaginibacter sp.]